jgi:hypothetical protein
MISCVSSMWVPGPQEEARRAGTESTSKISRKLQSVAFPMRIFYRVNSRIHSG